MKTTMKTLIMKNFAPLYSLNSNGSIQQWRISVENNRIIKEYGQIGGKMQTTTDTIRDGKNIGKSNETTPKEQAIAEATAQWEKKLKSGYSKTQKDAKAGKVDAKFVTGGIEPMLAHKFRDHEHMIDYPCYTQPKLDGIRCIAIIEMGVATLWTRTRKPITGVPHIIRALQRQYPQYDNDTPEDRTILDGELYNHAYKDRFEEIVSFCKQVTPKAGHEVVQYHVYDMVDGCLFSERTDNLKNEEIDPPLIAVETTYTLDAQHLVEQFNKHRAAGYEGTMVRNADSEYEHKRSYNLQKIKEFDDAEFVITGVKSGRGRMADCAIFTCANAAGDTFDCKMEGSLDVLKAILKNPKSVIGKMLTVRYQGFTNGKMPRFPIGVSVRDYE
jgi:DNA ligase-1